MILLIRERSLHAENVTYKLLSLYSCTREHYGNDPRCVFSKSLFQGLNLLRILCQLFLRRIQLWQHLLKPELVVSHARLAWDYSPSCFTVLHHGLDPCTESIANLVGKPRFGRVCIWDILLCEEIEVERWLALVPHDEFNRCGADALGLCKLEQRVYEVLMPNKHPQLVPVHILFLNAQCGHDAIDDVSQNCRAPPVKGYLIQVILGELLQRDLRIMPEMLDGVPVMCNFFLQRVHVFLDVIGMGLKFCKLHLHPFDVWLMLVSEHAV
mmetsp:Transcript_51591/g.125830  ORF Transcript_51591/g.125830 Transcript_51591/m.125830 type:complete len:268 (-) Transcript_51591:124-927(-)